jgi:hypothetical protein
MKMHAEVIVSQQALLHTEGQNLCKPKAAMAHGLPELPNCSR